MNAMLKISLPVVAVALFAATALADSRHPWQHSSDDFGVPNQSAARAYYAPRAIAQSPVVERRAYSFEPAPAFKMGDAVVVAKATSELKVGNRVLATLPKGTRFTIVAVQGGWIGADVEHNGQMVSGWLLIGDLATDATPAGAGR